MFFAPPKVRSLSKYSEFGSHMGEKQFLIMVALAIVVHLMVIGIYSMKPRERAMIIPVRVLNIKLDAGAAGLEMPKLSDMPGYVPPPPELESNQNQIKLDAQRIPSPQQAAANKIYNNSKQKSLMSVLTQDKEARTSKAAPEKLFSDKIPARPRKYVRETEIDHSTKMAKESVDISGNGTNLPGVQGGTEVVTRYTQELSAWVINHQIYPAEAKAQGIEGSATVRLTIKRDGHLLNKVIVASSGNTMLDQAALDMVTHSDPMPKVPDNLVGEPLSYEIMIRFKLKNNQP